MTIEYFSTLEFIYYLNFAPAPKTRKSRILQKNLQSQFYFHFHVVSKFQIRTNKKNNDQITHKDRILVTRSLKEAHNVRPVCFLTLNQTNFRLRNIFYRWLFVIRFKLFSIVPYIIICATYSAYLDNVQWNVQLDVQCF